MGKTLNGNKSLILGNHDRATKSAYLDAGFREVIEYPILWNEMFLLSHYPQIEKDLGSIFNIFGHVHNNPKFKDITKNGICVSVERIGYCPISFVEIVERRKKYE